jgi:nitrate reductase gamma subunit
MPNLFSIIVPYAAAFIFIIGIVLRISKWANAPVPFRIPATCGQQKSLKWIKSSRLDNPHTTLGVIGRMALEILFFRSLFRNTKAELRSGPRLVYESSKWLWLASLAFHWSLLIIVLRHLRFFTEPLPGPISLLYSLDGFFQIGLPAMLATDVIICAALLFLLIRRIIDAKVRYISLAADYVPLLLIGAIAGTGILMRHIYKVDISRIKQFAMNLIRLHPSTLDGIGMIFYIHLFFACLLIAYIPFSKLAHMAGIFLSPTRNLANNNRARRHVNPWNYEVKTHTYDEYENEFRPVMKEAGLPLEKEN